MFMRSSHLSVAFAVVALKLAAGPAIAQVQLQGAVGVSGQPIEQGVAVRAPHESSVIGRELRLNGENGHLAFQLKGADFVISKLVLAGEKISARGEACQLIQRSKCGIAFCRMREVIGPGSIRISRTPVPRISSRSTSVSPSRANFVAT